MAHRTADRAPEMDEARSRFLAPLRVGETRFRTPEGFLLCVGVPIARIGDMYYAASEIPVEPGPDGIVVVTRGADDLFRPETIASFEGKPVTNDHPPEDVGPQNFQRYATGTVMNVRRGDGEQSDLLLADLLLTEKGIIADLEAGKTQVSAGYDADYAQTAPGRGRQSGIVANHVALVNEGRCGERCAVGDHTMPKTKRTVWDRLTTAFKAKDEAAFNEELEAAQAEMETGEAAPQRVVIEVKTPDVEAEKAEGKGESVPPPEPGKTGDEGEPDPVAALGAKCDERFAKIEAMLAQLVAAKTSDAEGSAEEGEKTEGGGAGEGARDDEDRGKTADAAGLAPLFRDTVARAEILAPGVGLPTYDAKGDAAATKDTLCAFRRKVLTAAYATDAGRAAIAPFHDGAADFSKLTCDAARVLFVAASERAKASATGAILSSIRDHKAPAGSAGPKTPAQINAANRARWAVR